jgi:DNA-binding NarL/FixJ family response regulator
MLGGLDLLGQLAQNPSRPRTVVLSLHDDPGYVQQAMRLGAAGYVLKHSASTFLVAAVRDALAGRFFSSCPLGAAAPAESEAAHRQLLDRAELLTAEERLVLRLLAAGASEEQMAPKLAHQPLAVPMLCRNIALKFGLSNPADVRQLATRWAREN